MRNSCQTKFIWNVFDILVGQQENHVTGQVCKAYRSFCKSSRTRTVIEIPKMSVSLKTQLYHLLGTVNYWK
jgi:hypothetical protein